MAGNFGSDSFFLQLKQALSSGDREEFSRLVYEELEPVMNMELRKSAFSLFTPEDREDARQEAAMYVLGMMDGFMANPQNDPESGAENLYSPSKKMSWLHLMANLGLKHALKRVQKQALAPGLEKGRYAAVVSLNEKAQEDGDDERMDRIESRQATPEERVLLKERVADACRAFFGLNNSPSLLTAVGYVILCEALGGQKLSLEDYAQALNGRKVGRVISDMEVLLAQYEIDPGVLDALKARAAESGGGSPIEGLTAKTLANRKNSMLTRLSGLFGREKEEKP